MTDNKMKQRENKTQKNGKIKTDKTHEMKTKQNG